MQMLRVEDLHTIKERAGAGLSKGGYRAKINFHMGSCGIAAGAKKLNALVLQKMKENGIQDIQVIHSGCAGLCSREPMVTIESTGLPSVKYCDLNEKKIEEIFDRHILKGEVVDAYAFATEDGEPLPSDKPPKLEDIPFFKHQVLWALRNRGRIDNASFVTPRKAGTGTAALAFPAPKRRLSKQSKPAYCRSLTASRDAILPSRRRCRSA